MKHRRSSRSYLSDKRQLLCPRTAICSKIKVERGRRAFGARNKDWCKEPDSTLSVGQQTTVGRLEKLLSLRLNLAFASSESTGNGPRSVVSSAYFFYVRSCVLYVKCISYDFTPAV